MMRIIHQVGAAVRRVLNRRRTGAFWSARGAYMRPDGTLAYVSERSALWTSRAALLKEMQRSHPHVTPAAVAMRDGGECFQWVDTDGVTRFVVIHASE